MNRSLLAGCIALLAVACLVLAGCGPGTATYSKYGVKFEYPEDFTLIESGQPGEEPTEISGIVEVRREGGGTESFRVQWLNTIIHHTDPQVHVDDMLDLMEQAEGIESLERGEMRPGAVIGYPMSSQYYKVTAPGGSEACGIVAAAYFKQSQMVFSFITRTDAVSSADGAFEDFEGYIDSFRYVQPGGE
jgi:hypothetical protein